MPDESSTLSPRCEQLRTRIRDFVAHQVIPAEAALDAGDRAIRAQLREHAVEAGLWALPLPSRYGGGGLTPADYFTVAEIEGRSDHAPEVLGSAALLNARMIDSHADRELREKLLPAMVSGQLTMSYAMTEPGVAGSDPAALRTTATPDGTGWRITGRKWFITGAGTADEVLVVARTAPGAMRESLSIFAVPATAPGFRVVRELDVLGTGGQYEIEFDAVTVPACRLIGAVGAGATLAGERLALGRTLRALRWVGQAQRAVELLAERAAQRRVDDQPLAERQLVQQMVFDAELAVRSARALTEQAAAAVAADRRAHVEVGFAKVAAARALGLATDHAIQIFGAEGLTAATGLPRLLRVARAARILDGPDEFHIEATARRVIREYTRPPTASPNRNPLAGN
ncbi:acyl-CoA dehydrogenase family protein [Nocardia violaceofusca]|uniref:acyl-CoA dehydrogenase family protein n=1 Tax=Nocardia violaceofusca TaxID=941182 RepID=UPI0007A41C20|nr:acyl-CoA dehydrogenase family protein [Nocardia violaceofusca]